MKIQHLKYVVVVLWFCIVNIYATTSPSFSMPESVLLFGTYSELRIVTRDGSDTIKPPVDVKYNQGYLVYPSISPRGDLIAWGFATRLQHDSTQTRARFAFGLYSLAERKWKTYGDFDQIGNPIFASDGSKIAFLARKENKVDLLIFDVADGSMKKAPDLTLVSQTVAALRSWSPDGKRFAVEVQRGDKKVIAVLEINSGNMQFLGEGFNPAWAPNGEWIAYFDPSGAKCLLVHPDATGTRVVKKLSQSSVSFRRFGWSIPVWSPDSKQILLDEMKGDGNYSDIVLVDVTTGRSVTKARNGLPAIWLGPQDR
jgi:Tol biopolymer transport system component